MRTPRAGLTLAELLVVLTILAIMATIAVSMTDNVVEQGRFDATQRTLKNVESALFGPSTHGPDGVLQISGFVADMGRLPDPSWSSDPALKMHELLTNAKGVLGYGLRISTTDPDIQILCGWRGPYVQPPLGATRIIDGWANPLLYDGTGVMSLGANGAVGGDNVYDTDQVLSLPLSRYGATIAGQLSLLDLEGNARDTEPAEADDPSSVNVFVVLYGPDPTTGGLLELPAPVVQTSKGIYSYAVTSTIGPRVLRAYEKFDEGGMPSVRKSRIVSLIVPPGGMSQALTIQAAAKAAE